MPLNSVFGWFIKKRIHQIDLFMKYPVEVQGELFRNLIDEAALTRFGVDHGFSSIVRSKILRRLFLFATTRQ